MGIKIENGKMYQRTLFFKKEIEAQDIWSVELNEPASYVHLKSGKSLKIGIYLNIIVS